MNDPLQGMPAAEKSASLIFLGGAIAFSGVLWVAFGAVIGMGFGFAVALGFLAFVHKSTETEREAERVRRLHEAKQNQGFQAPPPSLSAGPLSGQSSGEDRWGRRGDDDAD